MATTYCVDAFNPVNIVKNDNVIYIYNIIFGVFFSNSKYN